MAVVDRFSVEARQKVKIGPEGRLFQQPARFGSPVPILENSRGKSVKEIITGGRGRSPQKADNPLSCSLRATAAAMSATNRENIDKLKIKNTCVV